MSAFDFYKGVTDDEHTSKDFSESTKLKEVRAALQSSGFMPADAPNGPQYRFLNQYATKEEISKNKAIIEQNLEDDVSLKKAIVPSRNTVILTDIKGKLPDLVGTSTEWLQDRKLKVRVRLNTTDPEAKKQNDKVGAMTPLVLSNVHPTTDTPGLYENVCVVVADSVVDFDIKAYGGAGFGFKVQQGKGTMIVDDLYSVVTDKAEMGKEHMTVLHRYQSEQKTIQIARADTQTLPDHDKVAFSTVTFATRTVHSYEMNGQSYKYDDDFSYVGGGKFFGGISGGGIIHGGPIKGPDSKETFGGIDNVQVDPWDKASGSVTVYFFVFKDEQSAKVITGAYNPPPEQTWE
ncbi:hypothetical protein ATK36_1367 [Amycolatopsis sulphurea]|uniref:Uncharacterized protein n=1 Tax=Amycolatopsis sulphurea TaxID=76022 RepID=A0A2A9F5Z5_9PSEU|nr:hypothetical protein [Amycolatopsis sulphurea]PFG46393.1 hypothetical protein ATK36_1367 [Amycolatopsis sulphurea]